ncbi:hypothetical protein [Corynebacterium gerontici]|uniref:Uncharacterized protein n=1 Tax=Corynebacterium gerontici TaxID=2079234 RepID=A0A3G6J1V8_9CORY|nr:hypothetical protein [Corynebacterium gerontici]AZA12035.1 hypothetical protein CGERO_08720 [Corynebacterium gerontici]
MSLPKPLKALAAILIVLFLLLVAGMIVAANRNADTPVEGKRLESTLSDMESKNISAVGLAMADLYGTEWTQGISICAGMTFEQIEKVGADTNLFVLKERKIPEDTNYIVLADREGQFKAIKLDTAKVDLCRFPGRPTRVDPMSLAPFFLQDHTWYLAG